MADKKHSTTAKPKPLHILTENEVQAIITERQSNSGFIYTDITLARVWTSQATGRRATGSSFFLKHEADLLTVIRRAAAWLRETRATPKAEAADQPLEDYEHEARKHTLQQESGEHCE